MNSKPEDKSPATNKENSKNYQETLANYRKNKKKMHSLVGTPDYIAPEVFNRTGYTEIIDWWSVGAILFEMLVGYAPFCSENPKETCRKVIQWKKYLNFPSNINIPREAADLIMKLMADESKRNLNQILDLEETVSRKLRTIHFSSISTGKTCET